MRVRHSTSGGDEKIELQMTPMIDIVFQLLIFFIMTFKIVVQEGDFNIKMPRIAPSQGIPRDDLLPPIIVRLTAESDGVGIQMGGRPIGAWADLRSEIVTMANQAGGPEKARESLEVELDCDYDLDYRYVIEAITHISGYVADDGQTVVRLIEKIKFASPREPGS